MASKTLKNHFPFTNDISDLKKLGKPVKSAEERRQDQLDHLKQVQQRSIEICRDLPDNWSETLTEEEASRLKWVLATLRAEKQLKG